MFQKSNLKNADVPFDNEFIFIDVETANDRSDICQIAAIITKSGKIVEIINKDIKPISKFNMHATHRDKHGLSDDAVKDAPILKEVWEKYFKKYENYTLVAHNATSDLYSLATDFDYYQIQLQSINYIDTEMLAEEILNCKTPSREKCCEILGIDIDKNHNALSDTIDCLNIFCKLFEIDGDILQKMHTYYFNKKRAEKSAFERKYGNKKRLGKDEKSLININAELDADFAGKTIVLTGDFLRFPQKSQVELEVIMRGGKTASSVSSKTNLLICGKNPGGSKVSKAKEFQSIGNDIAIIDEETFYKMLESNDNVEI